MKKIKTILYYLCAFLVAVSAVFAMLYLISVHEYTKAYGQLSFVTPKNYQPINFELAYTNTDEKYHNEDVETTDYLQGFRYERVYEGIHFLSSIDTWDQYYLSRVADELFKNIHGDEIKYLNAVIIEEGSGTYCYGHQEQVAVYYDTPLSIYNFFPENAHYYIGDKKSNLYVSNVSSNLGLADIAQAMSIAYGYHFTEYYMGLQGMEEDKETEYYSLRADGNENIRLEITDNDDYMDNYKWYLREIAANDYMFLMGSENANRLITSVYADYVLTNTTPFTIEDVLNARYRNGRNTTPHVNIDMPLPDTVEGLSDYFYSFVDAEAPVYDKLEPMGALDITLTRSKKIADMIYTLRRPPHAFLYEASWTPPYDSNQISYTVVKYNMDDEIVCVQGFTRGSSKTHSVVLDLFATVPIYYGYTNTTISERHLYTEYYAYDFRTDQEFKIRIIASFPNGQITISEPFTVKYPKKDW